MSPLTLAAPLQRLLDHAAASRGPLVVLTGAGISAESGIPTFRGQDGYWTEGSRNFHPQELATLAAFRENPARVWRWYLSRIQACRGAAPNAGHHAVVALERAFGERFTLITQNVDGLHLAAGSSPERVLQIHGNIGQMRCAAACHRGLYPLPRAALALDPRGTWSAEEEALLACPRCGDLARPHVLWFDESYDEAYFRLDSSLAAAQRCRLLLVVGTSASTTLPHHVVSLACASGASVVDINPERNPFSEVAEAAGGVWLAAPAGTALPAIAAHLTARLPTPAPRR